MREPVAAPGGPVRLRAEAATDAAFLRALFRSVAVPLPGLPPALVERLLEMQFRSQAATYRAAHPTAASAILERHGRPLGRLLLVPAGPGGDPGSGAALIVDYALLPDARTRGLGGLVLAAVLARAGTVTEAGVLADNRACLAMCARLGFEAVAEETPYRRLRWRPPAQLPA